MASLIKALQAAEHPWMVLGEGPNMIAPLLAPKWAEKCNADPELANLIGKFANFIYRAKTLHPFNYNHLTISHYVKYFNTICGEPTRTSNESGKRNEAWRVGAGNFNVRPAEERLLERIFPDYPMEQESGDRPDGGVEDVSFEEVQGDSWVSQ
jgi:hypothetical protein